MLSSIIVSTTSRNRTFLPYLVLLKSKGGHRETKLRNEQFRGSVTQFTAFSTLKKVQLNKREAGVLLGDDGGGGPLTLHPVPRPSSENTVPP
ncbi:hypothetical protein M0802_002853 [Mischocyttarus mexicanus]|nr:hypothetical protein M0802_002853 [Mischocyttarus mexicanus]